MLYSMDDRPYVCVDCRAEIDLDEDPDCFDDEGRCVCAVCREIEALARKYYDNNPDDTNRTD